MASRCPKKQFKSKGQIRPEMVVGIEDRSIQYPTQRSERPTEALRINTEDSVADKWSWAPSSKHWRVKDLTEVICVDTMYILVELLYPYAGLETELRVRETQARETLYGKKSRWFKI